MLKLSAHWGLKVPGNKPYSSVQVGAGIETEVADSERPEVIRERMRSLFAEIKAAIGEQLAQNAAPQPQAVAETKPVNRIANGNGNNGNGGNGSAIRNATPAQVRAILGIAKKLSLNVPDVLASYGVADPAGLSIKQASKVIDDLKAKQPQPQ
jgi:hypothetical protein